MPELDFVLLADGATDRPDGKVDVYGAGFDTIYATQVPARHARLTIVVRVLLALHEAERGHELALILMSEDGPELARAEAQVGVAPPEVRERVSAGERIGVGAILHFDGLIFPTYGRYHLAVTWDGTELRQPVRLKLVHPDQLQPGQAG